MLDIRLSFWDRIKFYMTFFVFRELVFIFETGAL